MYAGKIGLKLIMCNIVCLLDTYVHASGLLRWKRINTFLTFLGETGDKYIANSTATDKSAIQACAYF